MEKRYPLPPFDFNSATEKVQAAEDGWNTKNPAKIAQAYSKMSTWRNRDTFLQGRDQIIQFLTAKWRKELGYKLKKELWSYTDNRIAVKFRYEWHDDDGQWYRSYGNELWEFDDNGLMERREASINDIEIKESDREL